MTTTRIRQATILDLEALAPLFDAYRQFYGREPDIPAAKAFLSDRLGRGESAIFIAFAEHTPIGFCQLYPSFSSVSLARTFVLNDLFVLEHARRKGVARKLISSAIEFANASGGVRLSLSTAINNQIAQALYQSAGWKRDEQFLVYHFAVPAKPGAESAPSKSCISLLARQTPQYKEQQHAVKS